MHKPATWRIALALGIVYVVWGSTYLAIQFCVESLPPFLFSALWALVPGLLICVAARLRGVRPSHWRGTIISGILLSGTGIGVVAWAEQHVSSAVAALLFATVPLWTVLLQWLLPGGKRPSAQVALGLMVGMVGVAMLVGREALGSMQVWGGLVILAGAVSWATGSVYASRAALPESLMMTVGMQMSVGGGLVLVASGLLGEWNAFDLSQVTSKSWGALAYLIAIDSVIAYSAFMWLVRSTSLTITSTFAFVNPVVAVFLGWWLGGEVVTTRTLAAAGVILVSVIIVTRKAGHG